MTQLEGKKLSGAAMAFIEKYKGQAGKSPVHESNLISKSKSINSNTKPTLKIATEPAQRKEHADLINQA